MIGHNSTVLKVRSTVLIEMARFTHVVSRPMLVVFAIALTSVYRKAMDYRAGPTAESHRKTHLLLYIESDA